MTLYAKTDERLHWLSQIIAKANRTFVPKKEDDSHTNLYFDAIGNRVIGRWIQTENTKLIFTLNLTNLNIEILDNSQQVLGSYPTIGKTMDVIENEIDGELNGLGLTGSGFKEKLHFEIPVYDFIDEPIAPIDHSAITEWKHFRELANEGSGLILGHAMTSEEIRIWPHHFDTGIYVIIKDKIGLGFGLAMKDSVAGTPYFYMSGYPLEGSLDYVNLPEGNEWKWETGENWKGAVLTLDQLANKTHTEQKVILKSYLAEAFKWYNGQL